MDYAGQATMGRLKGGKRSERDDVAVKIEREIAEKARLVALERGTTIAELLSGFLRAPVDRAYEQSLAKLTQKQKGSG